MADGRERVWKLNEDGFRCLILRAEHRDMFLLRRKKLTYKAIGDLYQVSPNHARQLVERHMRVRRAKISRYLKEKNNREEPMTDDLVTRIRIVFEDTPEVLSTLNVETYEGAEAHTHMLGMWDALKEAAERIEELEAALREIANPANWEGMDWISHGVPKWIARAALEKKND